MESSKLNPHPEDPDQLLVLLRHQTPELPDDGFSIRVMTALPSSRARQWMISPLFIGAVMVGAAAGLGFALHQGSSWQGLVDGLGQVSDEFASIGSGIFAPGLFLALGLTGISLLIPYLLNRNRSRVG